MFPSWNLWFHNSEWRGSVVWQVSGFDTFPTLIACRESDVTGTRRTDQQFVWYLILRVADYETHSYIRPTRSSENLTRVNDWNIFSYFILGPATGKLPDSSAGNNFCMCHYENSRHMSDVNLLKIFICLKIFFSVTGPCCKLETWRRIVSLLLVKILKKNHLWSVETQLNV